MDSLSNWDDLISMRRLETASSMPQDDDLSLFFVDKNFDSLFNETLYTLNDLDVPAGFDPLVAPSQLMMSQRHIRQPLVNPSPYRHAKKPSGTAIFGFLDHNRELSLNGSNADVFRLMKPTENIKSISPTQLARAPPVEKLGPPVHINPNLSSLPAKRNDKQEADNIIVTKNNPKSYKFPPLPSPPPPTEDYLFGTHPLQTIQHPLASSETYPDNIDDILDIPADLSRRYVPIPVQYPTSEPVRIHRVSPPVQVGHSPTRKPRQYSPNRNLEKPSLLYDDRFSIAEQEAFVVTADVQENTTYPLHGKVNRLLPVHRGTDQLNMNMNVYMPPPSSTLLSHSSPEPHSPVLQGYSSPIHINRGQVTELSPCVKRNFYNPQFFSDKVENYYEPQPDLLQLSPATSNSIHSSPIRQVKHVAEANADDTVTDVNETILQLTPLRSQPPMTPSRKKITLEWSPIISPNVKDTGDLKKAIQELSPKRMVKKTSLLPPGELDRYWEGPDANKIFTCTYENCGKKFTRRYNVRSHIQTHLSDRPFTCSYCPKSFVRQHDLNRHVKSHMVSKYCRCRCGKEFTRVEGYKKHLANGVCSKGFDGSGGVSKPNSQRTKGETVLDGLTSNRLNEELGLLL